MPLARSRWIAVLCHAVALYPPQATATSCQAGSATATSGFAKCDSSCSGLTLGSAAASSFAASLSCCNNFNCCVDEMNNADYGGMFVCNEVRGIYRTTFNHQFGGEAEVRFLTPVIWNKLSAGLMSRDTHHTGLALWPETAAGAAVGSSGAYSVGACFG